MSGNKYDSMCNGAIASASYIACTLTCKDVEATVAQVNLSLLLSLKQEGRLCRPHLQKCINRM